MENDEQQQPEPMTDERLAKIRATLTYRQRVHNALAATDESTYWQDIRSAQELLAEVERLRAFVRDVLAIDADTDDDGEYYYVSPTDFGAVIDKASALAAAWERTDEEGEH